MHLGIWVLLIFHDNVSSSNIEKVVEEVYEGLPTFWPQWLLTKLSPYMKLKPQIYRVGLFIQI